jgi:dihydrodipicolinate reductase
LANVAINGLGRIGRAALNILLDGEHLNLVAVNDLSDADQSLEAPSAYTRRSSWGSPVCGASPPIARNMLVCGRLRDTVDAWP